MVYEEEDWVDEEAVGTGSWTNEMAMLLVGDGRNRQVFTRRI